MLQRPQTEKGFDEITTWVDLLSRRVHFIPFGTNDTALDCAKSFFQNIFKFLGLSDDIVSDRDPKFTSNFWTELMSLCGIRTRISTSHHPQIDGQSEIINRMVETFIRCYCLYNQKNWDDLLPVA